MFDSLTKLTEKIYLGEDSTIELKRELPHRESLADEIAAFANASGGVILIGVDDEGTHCRYGPSRSGQDRENRG